MDSAISATTKAARIRSAMPPLVERAVPCFSDLFRSTRKVCNAGASPNKTLASREIPSANASTPRSMCVSERRGTSPGARATSARSPQNARSTPRAPASRPISKLSVISCRRIRPRPAPSAARMAISLVRATDFASSMFARFAQAMSSTTATAASMIQSVRRKLLTISSRMRVTATFFPLLLSGYFCSRRAPIALICACACARLTSGFRRATT